jgi:ABC-type transport system involved in cytochrome c biogenesis permease subunit
MNEPTATLLLSVVALLAYGVGAALALAEVLRSTSPGGPGEGTTPDGLRRTGSPDGLGVPVAAAAGLLATVAAFVVKGRETGEWPVLRADEALMALSACVSFVFLWVNTNRRMRATRAVFLPATAVMALAALSLSATDAGRETVGPGALHAVHMLTVVAAATAYTAAFVGGVLYLAHSTLLRRRVPLPFGRLPPLEALENFNYRSAALGFPLMTVAVLTGFAAFGRAGDAVSGATAAGFVKIGLALAVWVGHGLLMFLVPRFRAALVARLNIAGFFVLWVVLLTARFAFSK